MKKVYLLTLLIILSLASSCAKLTSHIDVNEQDAFLNKLPMLNGEILGELKYDNSALDLRTLPFEDYEELFDQVELTTDYEKTVEYVQDKMLERKFLLLKDTFIICMRSKSQDLVLCDDAATPGMDKNIVGKPVSSLDEFTKDFIGKRAM